MKAILLTVLFAILAGCSSYQVERVEPNQFGEITTQVKINSLWRDVNDVSARYKDFYINIGSLGSATTPQELDIMALTCVVYPHLCPPSNGDQ